MLSDEKKPNEQKVAMCLSTFRNKGKSASTLNEADFSFSCSNYLNDFELGWEEDLDEYNFVVPSDDQYCTASNDEDFDEDEEDDDEEEVSVSSLWENIRKKRDRLGKKYRPAKPGDKDRPDPEAWKKAQNGYKYKNLKTGEVFTYDKRGSYTKDGTSLFYIGRAESDNIESFSSFGAEYQGRKVTLNKPFLTPGGPKKRAVYTRNGSGNVVIVRFGDPNMRIKKSDPERRKSFRARHNCDNPGPKWKARYWSCRFW